MNDVSPEHTAKVERYKEAALRLEPTASYWPGPTAADLDLIEQLLTERGQTVNCLDDRHIDLVMHRFALALLAEVRELRHMRKAAAGTPDSCPTCSGPTRETTHMICMECGTDYAARPPQKIPANAFEVLRAGLDEVKRLRASNEELGTEAANQCQDAAARTVRAEHDRDRFVALADKLADTLLAFTAHPEQARVRKENPE